MDKTKESAYIGSYKHPKKRKLVYVRVWASCREDAIRKFSSRIIHNDKVYPFYGFHGLEHK